MDYIEVREKLMNDEINNNTLVINGESGSGKTTLAIDKYKDLINNKKVQSERVLCLITNKYQDLTWKKEMCFESIGELKKHTYYGFIKKELYKYWPYILDKCNEIEKRELSPQFASFDVSKYIMKSLVDYFRKNKGYFSEINSTSSRISEDLLSNVNSAALNLIDFREIGERIYESLEVKDFLSKTLYDEMDKVIDYYRNSMIKKGIIDYASAINLYNQYLLKDERYKERFKSIEYLIVDDLEDVAPAIIELIVEISKSSKKNYLFKNSKKEISPFSNTSISYLEDIIKERQEITLGKSFLCKENMSEVARTIGSQIYDSEIVFLKNENLFLDVSSQLRSEMLRKVILKVDDLIKNGYKPNEISVICPFNDNVVAFELKKKAAELGISIMETNKKGRMIDNEYIHGLIFLACLCYEFELEDIKPSYEDYSLFFSLVLRLDRVRSSLLVRKCIKDGSILECNEEIEDIIGEKNIIKYKHVKKWIEERKSEECKNSLPEFFRKAYLEVLIFGEKSKENIYLCKHLSEVAEDFIKTIEKLEMRGATSEERFIDFTKSQSKEIYLLGEIEDKIEEGNSIVLTSPYSYLNSNLNSKVQIWIDINSDMWCPRNIKELRNSYVLVKNRNKYEIYNNEMDTLNRKRALRSIVEGILRKCNDEVYFYGSTYSINGYEQENILANVLGEIISKEGDLNE